MLTNVYVDGFNLYYGCLRGTPYKWLDLGALCARLLPRNQIKRIRYFTATVNSKPGDLQAPVRQAAYLRAIRTNSAVSVHLGHFLVTQTRMPRVRPTPNGSKTVEVIKTEEKGSDVNLATHLLMDAFQKDAQCFVVISNDSDLKEPLRVVAHDLRMPVGLVNPHVPDKRSRALLSCRPTFFKQIRASALASCQFPETLNDAAGTITKPSAWT